MMLVSERSVHVGSICSFFQRDHTPTQLIASQAAWFKFLSHGMKDFVDNITTVFILAFRVHLFSEQHERLQRDFLKKGSNLYKEEIPKTQTKHSKSLSFVRIQVNLGVSSITSCREPAQ